MPVSPTGCPRRRRWSREPPLVTAGGGSSRWDCVLARLSIRHLVSSILPAVFYLDTSGLIMGKAEPDTQHLYPPTAGTPSTAELGMFTAG